ncbi:2-hydroxychromene-2-carboxylate isomerase [Minwuia thermotolerans]|uniref:2-hydroxychromene-2-carboxylate isomerase n=1 Tax=Minwuia thermotolerans TaxID=2056226 RepID=A0A2M9FY70_9PROT|nr:2-hydroxychromene-2-carboxylate isomerase [Minwuia thermotolerans]PJK28408.1 disulfide bond formation protein DsbA [Minwuia thermotolerans]
MPRVEFHFDFGSPNAYLAHRVIPAVEQRSGAKFDYVPVLLGGVFKLTGNVSPMESLKGIRNKAEYGQLEMKRFVENHRIAGFRWNEHFPVNTVLIMRGALAAERDGRLADYVEAVFRAMWEDNRKMDDPGTVAAVLDAAGLDGRALVEATQDPAIKQKLIENTEASVERGNFGSPTFFVGDEMFFGKDKLRDVEDEIARQKAG